MNPIRDFTLALTYETETERKGIDRLSFHEKFLEPFYLPPEKWEVGLIKSLIPHTRLISIPRLRFDIEHKIKWGDQYAESTIIYTFQLPAQTSYSIDQYLIEVNKVIAQTIKKVESVEIIYELKCENEKLIIPDFNLMPDIKNQKSRVRFFDVDEWKKLGFLNIEKPNVFYDTPFRANTECYSGLASTTFALSCPNLIESQHFGDTYKPVLEVIPYHFSKQNFDVEFTYQTPLYKRLIGGYISEIDLELEDLDEKLISIPLSYFQFVLHFRPCQSTIKMR